ncbi:hypothetical protein LSCM4_07730 [Leishmania orientalis]|uniref:Uncharacterized protein n=1 Tax=Leishmania orientalis TaxID=2249476 RepID=A0A836GSA7_9TRYP|nr:hypothetical protein LSCM4_07730 [Leishmania orientalis]
MLESGYMRVAAHAAVANEADRGKLYASTLSTDCYSSSDEGAPDLEVEASPARHDGSPGVEEVRRDVDTSYFSDYAERDARRYEQAGLSPQLRLSGGVKEEDDACSRELLPHLCSDGHSAQPVTGVVAEGNADDFCDVEHESNMRRYRGKPFPPPETDLDAAVRLKKAIGSGPPLKSEGGRSSSWLDPLSDLSTPFSKDGAAAYSKQSLLSEDVYFQRQGPLCSPGRTSQSRFVQRTDRLLYQGGPPSVMVRESTVAPSPSPGSELNAATSWTTDQGARGHRRTNYASSSRASTVATIEAVHVVAVADVLTNHNHNGCGGGNGASTVTPTTPPRVTPRSCGARASYSPKSDSAAANSTPPRPLTVTATTPMRQQTHEDDTRTREMLPALETTMRARPQTRVVRDRPPRGAPLILQCTGHISTPTRTILVDHTMMDDDDTVTAGLHTSAYNEADDLSNLSSSSVPADEVLLLKGGEQGGSVGRGAPNRLPMPGSGMLDGRTCRAARSASPLLSLTDARFTDGDTAIAADQQQPESHRHDLDALPSSLPTACGKEGVDAMPDLIDFSVHTEGLGQSGQDDSLTLCGYSVERIRVPRDASAPPEICPRHQGPSRHPFFASSATGAIASVAALSNESRELFTASQDVEQLRVEGERYARPRAGGPSSRHPSHLERDAVQVVPREWSPRARTHPSSHKAYPTGLSEEDLSSASPSSLDDVRHLIESVEETPAPDRSFHPPPRATDAAGEGAGARGDRSSALSFTNSLPFDDSVEGVRLAPSSSNSDARRDGHDSLAFQRGRRKALRALLARQARSTDSTGCAALSHECADTREDVRSARFIAPAADYVATQEKLRGQRLAAEAERARLGLALDVCEAVRPHARDLLLMLLLLVEESNMRRRQRQRGQVQGRYEAASTHGIAHSSHVDATVWEESRVTYGTCAEAVNCVLERHGVTRVRATQELCRRVVAWSQHHNRHGPLTQRELLVDSLLGTVDEASVEYATFVSAVMEFAAQYRA